MCHLNQVIFLCVVRTSLSFLPPPSLVCAARRALGSGSGQCSTTLKCTVLPHSFLLIPPSPTETKQRTSSVTSDKTLLQARAVKILRGP